METIRDNPVEQGVDDEINRQNALTDEDLVADLEHYVAFEEYILQNESTRELQLNGEEDCPKLVKYRSLFETAEHETERFAHKMDVLMEFMEENPSIETIQPGVNAENLPLGHSVIVGFYESKVTDLIGVIRMVHTVNQSHEQILGAWMRLSTKSNVIDFENYKAARLAEQTEESDH